MKCKLYCFVYFRFFCCYFLEWLCLKNEKKNIELLLKELNGYFLICELIVLFEFVEIKVINISIYR